MSPALGILVGVSLALYLRAMYLGPAWQVYVCKPLTLVLVMVGAVVATRGQALGTAARRYGWLVCAGLLCSLAGSWHHSAWRRSSSWAPTWWPNG